MKTLGSSVKWQAFAAHAKRQPLLISAIVLLLSLSFFIPGCFALAMVLLTFGGGRSVCHFIFGPEVLVPNLLPWSVRACEAENSDDELTLLKKACPVCGNDNCSRHRPELTLVALQPWTNLKLPETVDKALEEFLNLVLKEFVYTWYRELSVDEAFVDELRTNLRFIIAVLLRRIQKVDMPTLITGKILKTAMKHLHFCLEAQKTADPSADMEEEVMRYYESHLHAALRNRPMEVDYLRHLAESVFPHILPVGSMKSKSLCVLLREILAGAILLPAMDVIADPDTINSLLLLFLDEQTVSQLFTNRLLLFLDEETTVACHDATSPDVSVLADFSQPLSHNNSCLHLELSDILGHTDALYAFLQFMKAEASVNVLQFYLTVETFNSKLLRPDLGDQDLIDLHQELQELCLSYCHPHAIDRIQFDDDIVQQLSTICDGPPEGIVKLQTSTPLFRAYEHAYKLLEDTFLPLFHQSDDYYQLQCGDRLNTRLQRRATRTAVRLGDALTLSKLGNKIKGVFKTNSVEGSLPGDVADLSEEADLMEEDHVMVSSVRLWDGPLRDLSAWRVTVPEVLTMAEPENPNRCYYTYLVDIRRVDVLEDDFEASRWTVERRYNEFYVLEQKLTEFHGEFGDAQLPAKKSFGTKNIDFLESKKASMEHYLQRLLTIPGLRGSELLYGFFTSDIEFSSSFLPDLNLGKMTNGAMRLVRKEKGQNLDPFLHSFLLSTETCKSKPCKWSDKDSDTISISSEKMANSVYENNANVDLTQLPPQPLDECDYTPADGAFDTLMYLADKVCHAPFWLRDVLLSVRIVIKQTLDTYLDCYLAQKLSHLSQQHYIVTVIHLLRDAIFFDTDAACSEEDKQRRQERALKGLQDYIPKLFVYCVGRTKHTNGTRRLLDLLQQPRLNKQLSYMLLDVIIEELFPELTPTSTATGPGQHRTLPQSVSLGQQTGPNRLVQSRHSIT